MSKFLNIIGLALFDETFPRNVGNYPTFITLTIEGEVCRFTRTDLRHENRGHRPVYRLYPTAAAYALETKREASQSLMALTNFAHLLLEKQRAIKAILEA